MKNTQRDSFASSIGVLLAMVGSAVGLGNIWRFPHMMGENGGAAFIIIYLLCAFLLAMPIMLSEFVIGRRSQENAVKSFKNLAPGTKWHITGLLGVFAAFIMISFYSVIGGWTLDYFIKSLFPSFTAEGMDYEAVFGNSVSGVAEPLAFTILFLLITSFIVSKGIEKGIEKSSKVMMPVLFILIVAIAIRSMTLPSAGEGLKYIFKPDFSRVTADTVLSALGQAFFSLSVGLGAVITYASYASRDENILKCTSLTVVADTMFAIIAGCAIMPAVFAFGFNPGEGAGLAFITLPKLFSIMPLGGIIAVFFFFSLLLAAISSSIAMQELMVSFIMDKFGLTRTKAVIINTASIICIASLCALSKGILSDIRIFGMDFLDLFDFMVANVLMIAGAILIVIFVGWKMGRSAYEEELTNRGAVKVPAVIIKASFFFIKYIAPAGIIVIAVYSILK